MTGHLSGDRRTLVRENRLDDRTDNRGVITPVRPVSGVRQEEQNEDPVRSDGLPSEGLDRRTLAPPEPAAVRVAVLPARCDGAVEALSSRGHNGEVDPVIVALAQLVRDRYERDRAEKAVRRARLRVLEGKSA